MQELNLGQIITTPQQRDAIHIAVMPATAAGDETLLPGQHVGFAEGGWWMTGNPQAPYRLIGVVDPFLSGPVKPRERFWLFMYPNTITSLRHEWTHPGVAGNGMGTKSESERWLHDFADKTGADYHEMMSIAATNCEDSARQFADYLIEGGRWEWQDTPKEFWTHYEAVTGKKPKTWESGGETHTPGIFSCSC